MTTVTSRPAPGRDWDLPSEAPSWARSVAVLIEPLSPLRQNSHTCAPGIIQLWSSLTFETDVTCFTIHSRRLKTIMDKPAQWVPPVLHEPHQSTTRTKPGLLQELLQTGGAK